MIKREEKKHPRNILGINHAVVALSVYFIIGAFWKERNKDK